MDKPRYEVPQPSSWVRSLHPGYLPRMERVIDDLTREWFSPTQIAAGYDRYIKACLTYVRMDQCQLAVMPWLRAALPDLQAMNVLEVGCGTGISTVPMAFAAKRVLAFDIDQPSVDAARNRCDILGVKNAEIFTRGVDWIENYARDPCSLTTEHIDLIYCYALLEHLLPTERVVFLQATWSHLRVGGHLVIVECPNRLHWFDWHSSQLPFADWLPEDLAMLYYGQQRPIGIWPSTYAKNVKELPERRRDDLYRNGRGVSFHEFDLSIGLDRIEVTAGAYSPQAIYRANMPGADPSWEQALIAKLGAMAPPVPREFAPHCLDLVLTKLC